MSLQTRLSDFITAVGTDYKQLRTWITGTASGDLTTLNTATKASIVAAINEVNSKPVGNTPGAASETVAGVSELATQAEVDAGTLDQHVVTPLKFQTRLAAYAQAKSANLTTLSSVVSGAFGRTLLSTADAAAAKTSLALTKTDVGLSNVPNTDATARANHTGTQPASTVTGLAAIATSGSASDITGGTLPTSVFPPLAINDTFVVASQAAMLALTAQRGDMAVRSDIGRTFVLTADAPATLANWTQITAGGDVTSVAGKTGAVALVKADVGLANVDNTADTAKPVSTAQQTAIDLRLLKTANLSDLANAVTARTNLSVYSQAELGNPETDLVAAYTTAKA